MSFVKDLHVSVSGQNTRASRDVCIANAKWSATKKKAFIHIASKYFKLSKSRKERLSPRNFVKIRWLTCSKEA